MHPRPHTYARRHLGPSPEEITDMLGTVGAPSLDTLIDETVPASIRLERPLRLPEAESEAAFHRRMRAIEARNRPARCFIGQGYAPCITPAVILRNVMENPGWYTPYTPYQAEIAQGRLEALLNFQTVITDLTGLPVANASLLDEATAAAEAMTLIFRVQHRRSRQEERTVFLVSDRVFPQTLDVLQTRAAPLGIQLRVGPTDAFVFGPDVFGALLQTPDAHGELPDLAPMIAAAHAADARVAVATDLLSLTLLRPPGEMGADVVLGNSQRFGVPMGYGGPHAAFFATRQAFVREMPGRVIGISVDAEGQPAYRMALQTREQHIRREKAKSNICTAQALLANMAGFYAVYHGPDGLAAIAQLIHRQASALEQALTSLGYRQTNTAYFDTLRLACSEERERILALAEEAGLTFHDAPDGAIGIAIGEGTETADLDEIAAVFAAARNLAPPAPLQPDTAPECLPEALRRTTPYLQHPVFHAHRSETDMMRYLARLQRRDIGLDTSMIPLGSCTMKLNPAAAMMPVTWPGFSALHPFAPRAHARGYALIFEELEAWLAEITGFAAVSLQPNSGAQGEYAGLLTIRAYHHARGEPQRDVVLIPASAHGTNPATAVLTGMEVVVVACDAQGDVDLADLRAKAEQHGPRLAALMVTYPSTHGVFEEGIREICQVVHDHGGQVYMDGANLNAQVGLTSPGHIGADVCHLNLHKTFSIPHGGGGPGMGPIGVAAHLAPFLPRHRMTHPELADDARQAVSAAPFGSPSILLISYAYIRLLGARGVTEASRIAILNANYVKARLEKDYHVLFTGPRGRVAHELIFDLRPFKQAAGVTEEDVAKRLMDYGFHAPTVSWPVPGTMMIEPTESESKAELDRFCDALLSIRREIQAIVNGETDRVDNPLKNAPHTLRAVTADAWTHPYSRETAAFPLPWLRDGKVWPTVARIDNPHGDRNLVCSCQAQLVPAS